MTDKQKEEEFVFLKLCGKLPKVLPLPGREFIPLTDKQAEAMPRAREARFEEFLKLKR